LARDQPLVLAMPIAHAAMRKIKGRSCNCLRQPCVLC